MNDNSPSNEFTAGDRFFGQMIEAGVADKEFIKEIVEMFIVEGKQTLVSLNEAVQLNELKNIQLYAHKLKSSFLMFDMLEAHQIASSLESINSENQGLTKALITELTAICDLSFARLANKFLNT